MGLFSSDLLRHSATSVRLAGAAVADFVIAVLTLLVLNALVIVSFMSVVFSLLD